MKQLNKRIGLGSFAYRYAIGIPDFQPEHPMTPLDFLEAAARLGVSGVQLCENLGFAERLDRGQLTALRKRGEELNLFMEVGMRDITVPNLLKHLEICEILGARFLRVVLGNNRPVPEADPEALISRAVASIGEVLPQCRKQGVTVGIENHFDLRTADLIRVMQAVNDPSVGMILDTTNCLGFGERPEEALAAIAPYLISIHLKDYQVRKVEAGYLISGTPLGEGWLDIPGILGKAFQANPGLSVILELTVRRGEGRNPGQVLADEQNAIERSVTYLNRLIESLD